MAKRAAAPESCVPAKRLERMRGRLLEWYGRERRRLPWRERPGDYGTVVSEFMLQQTQVAAVVPFFERFLKRFKDFKSLAAASEEEVLAAWSGLGYYRRARMLKRAAEAVVKRHGGRLPADAEALRELPGFGGYTAAAVGSIALGLPLAAVDGNVRRVVSRLFAIEGAGADARVAARAGELLDPARPGDWNQAMMELGATVCSPRAPKCMLCPLREDCAALASGAPERFPAAKAAPALKRVREVAVVAERKGKILLLQCGDGGSFAGMWELPRMDSREVDGEDLEPGRALFELARLRAEKFRLLGRADSTFTHHRIATELYAAEGLEPGAARRQRNVAMRWAGREELAAIAASKAQRRLFGLIDSGRTPKRRASEGAEKMAKAGREAALKRALGDRSAEPPAKAGGKREPAKAG